MFQTPLSITVVLRSSFKASAMAVFKIVVLPLCLRLECSQTFPNESQTMQSDKKPLTTESETLENRNGHSTIPMETTDIENTKDSGTTTRLTSKEQFTSTGSDINGETVTNGHLPTATNELSYQSETTIDTTVHNVRRQNKHATNPSTIMHCENLTATISSSSNNSECQIDESRTDEVKPKPKVDYIGYITTPIFFIVGIIGIMYSFL